MILRYTESGYLVILPHDNPHSIVNAMLGTGYGEDCCVSLDFSPDFIAHLMEAGFLVMSVRINNFGEGSDSGSISPYYLLLPCCI